ncbi:MAG TPA: FAD-dependent oxidoreductase, partial [Acidimicrobiales bacterium]
MPDIDRRRFLAGSAAATTAAAAVTMASPARGLLGIRTASAAPVADPKYQGKRHVAILGGGCAGLSAAHELIERGFTVDVYERYPVAGGKCRSIGVPDTGSGGRPDLPGEHGFRFFPGYYKHITDTMARTPYGSNRNGVKDNLAVGEQVRFSRDDAWDMVLPYHHLDTANPVDLINAIVGFIGVVPGLGIAETIYFATRLVEFVTACDARRDGQYDKLTWWEFVKAERYGPLYQKFLAKALTRNLVAADALRASTRTIGLQATRILVCNIIFSMYDPASRVLNGPTSEVWIDPWLSHLRGKGINWIPNTTVEKLHVGDGEITGVTVSTDGRQRNVGADVYILAVPVERARELLDAPLRAIDPGFKELDTFVADWMTGAQYFLKNPLPINKGHISYVDSPWA